jgi:lysophospholipase L1-like esterase
MLSRIHVREAQSERGRANALDSNERPGRASDMTRRTMLRVAFGGALIVALASAGCSGGGVGAPSSSSPSIASPGGALSLVFLGDSIAVGDTCEGCTLFSDQLAETMGQQLGAEVTTQNLAVDGAEVADLLKVVRTDQTVRTAVAGADAVVVTIGLNDLAFNRLDDPCGAAPNYPVIRWEKVTHGCVDKATLQYRRSLDTVLGAIQKLREGKPSMLRVTTVYNSVIGDLVDPTWNSPAAIEPSVFAVNQMAKVQCEVARMHEGSCADTYHALNGKDGRRSAQSLLNSVDATHLAQAGEDAFAHALLAAGFSPLGA